MTGVLWFDASNHQWRDAQTWAQELQSAWARGERGVVVNTYGPTALPMLEAAHLLGFRLRVYRYLDFPGGQFWTGLSAHDQVSEALDKVLATGLPLERIGLDCEDEGNNLDPAATVAFIQEAADACSGRLISELYTAPAWWRRCTGDSHAFATYPLWLAAPTGSVPDSFALPDPFGGWQRAAEIQYDFHGHIDDGGTDFDLDAEDAPTTTDSNEPATATDAQQGSDDVPPKVLKQLDIAQADVAIEVARAQINGGHATVQEVDIGDPTRVGVLTIVDRAAAHAGDPNAF